MFEELPIDRFPRYVQKERGWLIEEIQAAFSEMSRTGGTSWHAARTLCGKESGEPRGDQGRSWQALLQDPTWNDPPGLEWFYLAPIGFAYYLPAGMIRTVLAGRDQGPQLVLSQPHPDLYDSDREESLLNLRQATAVKGFLHYMLKLSSYCGDEVAAKDWEATLAAGWNLVTGYVSDKETACVVEGEALIAEIFEVFGDVNRKGAISWSETDVIDRYGGEKERRMAGMNDLDGSWQGLVDDSNWAFNESSAWCFLDAKGHRYYLPAAMIRTIHNGWDQSLSFHLRVSESHSTGSPLDAWSALDEGQRACVARYIRFMADRSERVNDVEFERWDEMYRDYWGRFEAAKEADESDGALSEYEDS